MTERQGAEAGGEPLVLLGPTASGKGAVAFELAGLLDAEIVCVDSMKVYRELDVGTAKPSAERRAAVRYHLLDVVDPHLDFSVGQYLALLAQALADIAARGRRAILCGGTALYLKAYLWGLQAGPAADWALRARLLEEAARTGGSGLHERLQALDPGAATKIHPQDVRRIVRALEVRARTGRPLSEGWRWGAGGPLPAAGRILGLSWERSELYGRIDRRVWRMVEGGLFAEVERLRRREPPLGRTASQSIGYKEVLEASGAAGAGVDAIVERIQRRTRRFAKSQLTWFRKFPVRWIALTGEPDPARVAREIAASLASR
jgi:tRNA dimethylallyltransferase